MAATGCQGGPEQGTDVAVPDDSRCGSSARMGCSIRSAALSALPPLPILPAGGRRPSPVSRWRLIRGRADGAGEE